MANALRYIVDYIPPATPYLRRTRITLEAQTITIHNTGNPSSSARGERGWLTNPANKRRASFHDVVDESEVVKCVPHNEVALHAGSAIGNRSSIGVEICESGNYAKALENAIEHVANLLRERGWGVDRLRRHWDWSKKICPRLMYDGGKWTGWIEFNKKVAAKLLQVKVSPPNPVTVTPEHIRVFVNGKMAAWGIAIDGETWAPSREVGQPNGATIGWDNGVATANGEKLPTRNIGGRGFVPVRELAEACGWTIVGWDGKTKTVTLTT